MSKKYDNPYNYIKKTSKLYDTVITVHAMEYKIFKCPECEKDVKILESNNKFLNMGFICKKCCINFQEDLLKNIRK